MSDKRRSQANPLLQLSRLGQSLWYDYVTRDLFVSADSYASVLAGIEAKVGALAAR